MHCPSVWYEKMVRTGKPLPTQWASASRFTPISFFMLPPLVVGRASALLLGSEAVERFDGPLGGAARARGVGAGDDAPVGDGEVVERVERGQVLRPDVGRTRLDRRHLV